MTRARRFVKQGTIEQGLAEHVTTEQRSIESTRRCVWGNPPSSNSRLSKFQERTLCIRMLFHFREHYLGNHSSFDFTYDGF